MKEIQKSRNKAANDDMREVLFDYADELFRWAFSRTGSRENAEDLVQDTFLSALGGLNGFQKRSHIKTWLFSILNNKINEYYRKQLRGNGRDESQEGKNTLANTVVDNQFDRYGHWEKHKNNPDWSIDDDNDHLLDDPDFRKVMQLCLEDLPENWFTVIHLKYLTEVKDSKKIYKELGISQPNFWQLLHRAKMMLKACLEQHWFKKQ